MKDLRIFKKNLINIFINNKLCISINPLGIDKLWPKSFIEKYYYKLFYKLINTNNEIKILELDTKNKYQLILWRKVFKTNSIEEDSILNVDEFKCKVKNFDLIMVNYLPENKTTYLKKIIKTMNQKNLIIIENIFNKRLFMTKIFFSFIFTHDFTFEDYRLNKFIKNNCLLTIRKKPLTLNILKNLINFKKYITYIIVDMFYSLPNLF
ncbi:MAG: hypothetical protein CBC84_001805 [Pelagibacteraceae bacterium TMED124]|nr:MAG: hypothetical protein CBC84_001805 [Pelagibacteraceae bacterium TMED124]